MSNSEWAWKFAQSCKDFFELFVSIATALNNREIVLYLKLEHSQNFQ